MLPRPRRQRAHALARRLAKPRRPCRLQPRRVRGRPPLSLLLHLPHVAAAGRTHTGRVDEPDLALDDLDVAAGVADSGASAEMGAFASGRVRAVREMLDQRDAGVGAEWVGACLRWLAPSVDTPGHFSRADRSVLVFRGFRVFGWPERRSFKVSRIAALSLSTIRYGQVELTNVSRQMNKDHVARHDRRVTPRLR